MLYTCSIFLIAGICVTIIPEFLSLMIIIPEFLSLMIFILLIPIENPKSFQTSLHSLMLYS